MRSKTDSEPQPAGDDAGPGALLLPALAFFVALTVYAVWRRQRRQTTRTDG